MASSVKEWVAQLASEKPAEAFKGYKQAEDAATRATAPGKESARAELAAALAAELNAKTAPRKDEKGKTIGPEPMYKPVVHGKICRLLACVAGAKEVPALVEALGNLSVREPARCALAANASAEATEALIKALEEVGAEFRVGVVNALGKRPGEKVVSVLRKAAAGDEAPEVRIAAVEALANIPEPANAEVVLKATQCKCPVGATRAWKAAVRLAENLRKVGMKSEAAELYRKIEASGPKAQKAAAGIGLKAKG